MKLLLVEDDRELSNALRKVLVYNKYDVDVAYDGIEALDYLAYTNYDGVILDVMMPRLDGYGVVKKIRADKNNVPVLMLTAKGDIDDKVTGLDAGADDYLAKPFVIKELLARIRALTRRKFVKLESLEFGNMKLDSSNYLLSANKSVRLTNKEYKIMELLMRNRGTLLSTEKIMESIWEIESEADLNVVWVFISALRKKMISIGSDSVIKAVRGVGYTLEEKNNG